MKTSGARLFFAVAALASALALADPRMPEGFVVSWSDTSGLTWRETGAMPSPLKEALAALKASMKKQGYELRHDITGDAFGDMHLFLWFRGDEEVTVMVWPDDDKNTGLSWGVTTAGQDANSNTNSLQKGASNGKDK